MKKIKVAFLSALLILISAQVSLAERNVSSSLIGNGEIIAGNAQVPGFGRIRFKVHKDFSDENLTLYSGKANSINNESFAILEKFADSQILTVNLFRNGRTVQVKLNYNEATPTRPKVETRGLISDVLNKFKDIIKSIAKKQLSIMKKILSVSVGSSIANSVTSLASSYVNIDNIALDKCKNPVVRLIYDSAKKATSSEHLITYLDPKYTRSINSKLHQTWKHLGNNIFDKYFPGRYCEK